MDNENKKVNSSKSGESRPGAFDEIMDGFYDLTSLYSEPPRKIAPKNREEELRMKDEMRRKLEMQAIKEDIERRYSLQLENAQSNSEPVKTEKARVSSISAHILPEIDEHETVREELDRIDRIINNEDVEEISENKRQEEVSAEESETIGKEADYSNEGFIYSLFYNFGDCIYRFLSIVFGFIFKLIKAPFVRIYRAFSSATESTKQKAKKRFRATLKEIVHFRQEIKHALKFIKRAIKKPKSLPTIIAHYFKKAFSRHNNLLKTAVNILLPIGALAIFILTVNYWNGVTYALEVIYNNQSIGYISDESVFIEARDLVKDRLSSGAYASETVEATVAASPAGDFNAEYSLTLVSLDELNDAQTISDKMIENSVDNLTHACGVYIDGKFICAVKNEADAKTVFNNILAPYETEADRQGYVVSFAETIDYVQGLYRDDASVMWDASRLSLALNGENPDAEKLISIKKIVTSSSIRDIKFETVTKRDATKYSGYRRVSQEGVNGSERVIKTQIYVDGVLQNTDYSYETIKEPVDEIVTVGTKTSYNGVYIGSASDKGFLWPAPSCHYVSSAYGWRSRGWHKGIDLVKSGGGALGTPVIASKSGRVEVVQRSNSGYGYMVLINHGDGYKTRYAHMVKGSITVSVGDYVDAGQTIGKVGSTGNSTGPHLHFEVIYNGETYNPANYIY